MNVWGDIFDVPLTHVAAARTMAHPSKIKRRTADL
jgi:hypothetical protein